MQLFPGRRSYALILANGLVDAVWLSLSPIDLPFRELALPAINIMLLTGALASLGFIEPSSLGMRSLLGRISYLLKGIVFLQLSWIVVRLFNHLSMATDYPYADPLLSHWDGYIPVSWFQYFDFVQNNELIIKLLAISYTSLTTVSFVAFVILIWLGDLKRTQFFLETFLIVAVCCTTIGMFFPAKAAVATYFQGVSALANFAEMPGVYHLEHMERLRGGGSVLLDLDDLPGLVTFPSFHTAAGIVLLVTFWRTALFPLVAAYTSAMIASTPIFGGHYFVDLIAGVAIAGVVLFVFARLPRYSRLFGRTDDPARGIPPKPASIAAPG